MKILPLALLIAAAILLGSGPVLGDAVQTDPESQPKELGSVRWYRNLDDGIAAAKADGRPLFVQFQEVPG
jgi:hypothetical protein